ncbi:hypothetical protein HPB47_026771, partial [Ixodes persulcatus]
SDTVFSARLHSLLLSHVGGALCGAAMGVAAIRSLRLAPQSQSSSTVLLIFLTYLTFCLLEVAGASGVDGVVVFTLVTNAHRRVACTELEGLLHKYWSAIYNLVGLVSLFMSSLCLGELLLIFFEMEQLQSALLSYCVRTVARFFSLVALFPIIEQFGYTVSWRQAVITVWMGLKGPLNITVVSYYYHVQASRNVDFVSKTFLHVTCDILLSQLINLTLLEFVFRIFGGLQVSEVERRTMSSAVTYLRDQVCVASWFQRTDSQFLRVDWNWVARHTLIENPFARLPTFSVIFKRRQSVQQDQIRAERSAVENVLRIQQVSYSRQYRQGMIQKSTMMTLLAALQYRFDKKIYLDYDMIERLIKIPDWIKWMKECLSVSKFGEDMMNDMEFLQSDLEKNLQDLAIDLFEHQFYELVITSTTLAFLALLTGTLLNTRAPNFTRFERILVLEGIYIALFAAEIGFMITAYGHRFVRLDNYNKLDLVLLSTCVIQFITQLTVHIMQLDFTFQTMMTCFFIFAMSVRLVHLVKYVQLLKDAVVCKMHRFLDMLIYSAYETSLAIITAEEEVQQNLWKYVASPDLALEARSRAANNRLMVLRNLVEIQSRFPGIAVAFKSRQAGRTILNDVCAYLDEMQRDGIFGEDQHRELYQAVQDNMLSIICAPNSLPASYMPIAVLRVIPWIDSDSVRQFLAMQLRPVTFPAEEVIVEMGCESPIIVTYSGIVKVEGVVEPRNDGALPNASSSLFFFSDEYFEDYLGAPFTLGTFGLVSDEPTVTRVSSETTVSTWPLDKIKLRLSSLLLPDLSAAHDFLRSPDIEDIVLVQGSLVDVNCGDLYVAPAYIPRSVKRFIFP